MIDRYAVKSLNELKNRIQADIEDCYSAACLILDTQKQSKELIALAATLRDCAGIANPLEAPLKSPELEVKFDYVKKIVALQPEICQQNRGCHKEISDYLTKTAESILGNHHLVDEFNTKLLNANHDLKLPMPQQPVIIIKQDCNCYNFKFFDYFLWNPTLAPHRTHRDHPHYGHTFLSNASNSSSSSSARSESNDDKHIMVIIGFIIAGITACIAACYAIPKACKSLWNLCNGDKLLRSSWRLAAMAGTGYGGATLGASIGSAFPVLGTIFGGVIGAGVGAMFAKYSARAISAATYPNAVNPTNPEKYELSKKQSDRLKNDYDLDIINKILKTIRTEKRKKPKGFYAYIPCTTEWQERRELNSLLQTIKDGTIKGFIKIGKQTFYPQKIPAAFLSTAASIGGKMSHPPLPSAPPAESIESQDLEAARRASLLIQRNNSHQPLEEDNDNADQPGRTADNNSLRLV